MRLGARLKTSSNRPVTGDGRDHAIRSVVGIGAGDLDHITMRANARLGRTDMVLIPSKGAAKVELAENGPQVAGRRHGR